jgi:predicted glycosyltransferase
MNILIDIGHPAHVHLFRNAATKWIRKGHKVVFTIRDRKMVAELVKAYGFNFFIASKARTNTMGLFFELVEHDWNVLKVAIKMKVDLLIGTSVSITHVSKLLGKRSIIFNEDDADYLKSFSLLAYPFADTIVIPDCLRDKRSNKYITYPGYHELAYLHPNNFTPDPAILDDLGVKPHERFFIIRLVAWKAHHDKGHIGINELTQAKIIRLLSQYGKVFITAEGELSDELCQYQLPIPPDRIHHALSYASMLVCDSQTMTIEAAVLGTPAIRYNTFVGLCSVIEELENKYGLTYGFLPKDEDKMLEKINLLINDPDLRKSWDEKRQRMLHDKIDLAQWMYEFVENYPQSWHNSRSL